MEDSAVHQHPKHPEKTIFGQLLQHKDEIEVGDMHSDPDDWVRVPDGFAGCAVLKDMKTKFVRPATSANSDGGDIVAGIRHMIDVLSDREAASAVTENRAC